MDRLRAFTLILALPIFGGCADDAREWVAACRTESELADAAEEAGRPSEAMEQLERLIARPVPEGVAAEDARVLHQDALARLARLSLDAGDSERARHFVERGLALGEEEDLFTANLLVARGRAHEAEGRDAEAARDYHRALEIHDALLDRALGGALE